MTPREAREKKLQKLEEQKAKPLQKISNNFIQIGRASCRERVFRAV